MPDIHQHKREEHRQCVKDVHEELMMVDVDVDGRSLTRAEFDEAEDNTILRFISKRIC